MRRSWATPNSSSTAAAWRSVVQSLWLPMMTPTSGTAIYPSWSAAPAPGSAKPEVSLTARGYPAEGRISPEGAHYREAEKRDKAGACGAGRLSRPVNYLQCFINFSRALTLAGLYQEQRGVLAHGWYGAPGSGGGVQHRRCPD